MRIRILPLFSHMSTRPPYYIRFGQISKKFYIRHPGPILRHIPLNFWPKTPGTYVHLKKSFFRWFTQVKNFIKLKKQCIQANKGSKSPNSTSESSLRACFCIFFMKNSQKVSPIKIKFGRCFWRKKQGDIAKKGPKNPNSTSESTLRATLSIIFS